MSKVCDFNLLHLHLVPLLWVTPQNFAETFGYRKLVPGLLCGII